MSKFFEPAVAIRVQRDDRDEPEAILYKKKVHRVGSVTRRWRVREGWWRDEIAREYFEVEAGRFVCMVYRDLLAGNWFLQRVYD